MAWCCGLAALPLTAAPAQREAPNPGAVPVDQLAVSGNACGPAALLTALRFGDANWQRAASAVAGDTDKARLVSIIRIWGLRPSATLTGRMRWTRQGVNVDDLCAMANEMTRSQLLPLMKRDALLSLPGESPQKLLARTHDRLETSLRRGLPPIISIRRIARRVDQNKVPSWVVLQGHYVTVVGIPGKLEKNSVFGSDHLPRSVGRQALHRAPGDFDAGVPFRASGRINRRPLP